MTEQRGDGDGADHASTDPELEDDAQPIVDTREVEEKDASEVEVRIDAGTGSRLRRTTCHGVDE